MHVDPRAHTVEFRHVHEAVLKNGFSDHGGTFGDRHDGHELGLHVGGEARERFGHHVRAAQAVAALNPNAVLGFGDFHPGVVERAAEGGEGRSCRPRPAPGSPPQMAAAQAKVPASIRSGMIR